jgi:hypothetical protein
MVIKCRERWAQRPRGHPWKSCYVKMSGEFSPSFAPRSLRRTRPSASLGFSVLVSPAISENFKIVLLLPDFS